MMTMSLRMSVGARHCSTYARNVSPVIAPVEHQGCCDSIVAQSGHEGDGLPMSVRHATDQSLAAWATAAQPHHFCIGRGLVDEHQSGRIKHALLSNPAPARATSARSCSAARRLFFERDLVSSEKSPERGAAAGDPPLAHRDKHLVERQIRLFRDQGEQPIRPLLQWRSASSVWYGHGTSGIAPALKPFDRRTGADLKMFGSLAPRSTALNSCDDALSKFHRIRVWHCSTSKSGINANRLAHKQPLGNPSILLGTFRFYSAETCSSAWLRGLIQPPPGCGIAYIDWSQQEFGIAAALS